MMFGWMVFSMVAAFVLTTFVPKETELPLSFSVLEPVEAHLKCLHAFNDDGFVYKSFNGGVVVLDWWLWLWPSHFALWSGTMSCAHLKSAAVSASPADARGSIPRLPPWNLFFLRDAHRKSFARRSTFSQDRVVVLNSASWREAKRGQSTNRKGEMSVLLIKK